MTLPDLLRSLGVEYKSPGEHHHCTSGRRNIDCPDCSPRSGKWRLGIADNLSRANCWVCGPKSPADALAAASGRDRREIYHETTRVDGYRAWVPREVRKTGTFKLPAGCGSMLPAHKAYLRGRGFDPDELEATWGLLGTGQTGCQRGWRVVAPVTLDDQPVSWTARAIGKHGLRYLTAKPEEEAVSIRSLLYGFDKIRHCAVVTEGPTGPWRIGPGCVATLGVGYSRAQLSLLADVPVRVICFDPTPDAQQRAAALCGALAAFDGETVNVELETGDPGEASGSEIEELKAMIRG